MNHLELIKTAIEVNASDIHIAPYAKPMLRVNGTLKSVDIYDTMTHEQVAEGVRELCSNEQLERLEHKGEVHFSFSITEYGRFRVNIIKQRGTYSISIRILKLTIPTRETLEIPNVMYELASQGRGLILVSGASGSGRSTTMASLVQHLNESECLNIITVESPIEYLFKHGHSIVLQRDVGIDCDSVYEGIKSIMRHDPDVVMISDVSDEAALELALQISESGKLVIAGIPSINAVTTIESIIASAKPERRENRKLKLASNLSGIIAQQLVPTITSDKRVLCYELLLNNTAIRSSILSEAFLEIRNTLIVGKKQGMTSMDFNLFERFAEKVINQETLYKFCQDVEFVKRLERSAHKLEGI